jgi:hypothetical protein
MNPPQVIALDLEGTLISNAFSQFARPGLREFLGFCRAAVPRVVIYTAVREAVFRPIAAGLVAEGAAPPWFSTIEYIDWSGERKDLRNIPDAAVDRCVLVDDHEGYAMAGQEDRWIRIRSFGAPYLADDLELARVERVLVERFACRPEPEAGRGR